MNVHEERLRRLWAVCTALRGLPTPRAKGIHLQKACRRDPALVRYLRYVYDPTTAQEKTQNALINITMRGKRVPKELRQMAAHVLARDLKCGLSLRVVNKVLENLEQDPIPVPVDNKITLLEATAKHTPPEGPRPAETGLAIEIYMGTPDYAHGDILWQGTKTGSMTFIIGHGARKTIACLRSHGVVVRPSPTATDVGEL